MLVELTIKEFAIIENLRINFNNGLNILTGETGAGKSIIVDAIQLLIGGRSSVDFVRSRAEKSEIEALFDLAGDHSVYSLLEEYDIEHSREEMFVIKRELFRNGKSICRINGQVVNLAVLKEVGERIIQLYSQLQHQQLLNNTKQLALLDGFAEDSVAAIKQHYSSKYKEYSALKKELLLLLDDERELSQKLDLLKYQIAEITAANLTVGEEDELNQQKNLIRHAEKISKALNNMQLNLADEAGIVDMIANSLKQLESIVDYDESYKQLHEELSAIYYQLESMAQDIAGQVGRIEFDSAQLDLIEERLNAIHFLKRKYGDSIESIHEFLDKSIKELDYIENRETHLEQLKQKLQFVTKDLLVISVRLSEERKLAAVSLARLIEQELTDLQMENTRMEIELSYTEDSSGIEYEGNSYQITGTGLDQIDFLISPNPGEPLKPLNKIASGGELSRIMLATLTILAEKEEVPTLIFDEVDTGVSGKAAQAIAEKLAVVSKTKQVFSITHLSQVAAMADSHYLIQKDTEEMITKTNINQLNDRERVDVLAIMLGGAAITDTTYLHAAELIEKAKEFKERL